jgi:glucose/arabinose dehydrogenase
VVNSLSSKSKVFLTALIFTASLSGFVWSDQATRVAAKRAAEATNAQPRLPAITVRRGPGLREVTANLPLSFEQNVGQQDGRAKFSARGAGYNLFLTATGALLELRRNNPKSRGKRPANRARVQPKPALLEWTLQGAKTQARVTGVDQLPGRRNYFIGNDPACWHSNVPTFRAVRYDDIYPGISLTYYGNQGQLEYDFNLAPGTDPRMIRLTFAVPVRPRITSTGDLALRISGGEVRQPKPVVYQEIDGQRHPVAGQFVLLDKQTAGFAVGPYDHTRELVIDPTLVYATYLGGGGDDLGSSIAVDSNNNIYVAGTTSSTNFPLQGAAFGTNAGLADIFVTKIDAAGANVLYSTYIGGSGQDRGDGLAVDANGNAFVVGRVDSSSTNFPATTGSFGPSYRGGDFDGVVFKLNAQGSALVYSGFLGGEENDSSEGVVVDAAGNAYVTGGTKSTGFPTSVGAYQGTRAGDTDAFLTKINASGSALLFSTYLGGSGTDRGSGIAIDASGNAYLSGFTSASDFPTENAFQNSFGGSFDAFVAKFDTNASGVGSLVFCSYLGGSGDDKAYGLAIDAAGNNLYLSGQTSSVNFPLLGPVQPTAGGSFDAFVARVSTAGAKIYATYLGGSGEDRASGIAVNAAGAAYVTGFTSSTNFPTVAPIQLTNGGGFDAFVAKLNPAGSALLYSTYLGGSANESNTSTGTATNPIALDANSDAYLTGFTASTNFPVATALQTGNAGGQDSFVVKIADATPAADFSIAVVPSSRTVLPGGGTSYTVTATPVGGFTGTIALSAAGLSSDSMPTFNPASININDVSAQSATLTVTTAAATPPGNYSLSVTATSGNLQHLASAQLVVSGTPSANLSITKTASPNPAISLASLTYRIVVTNNGPSPATNVTVTDQLPAGPAFGSAIPSQGACSGTTTVTCNPGSIANASSATISITVTPQTVGQLSNSAGVVATENDPDTSDNSVAIQTAVNAPSSGPTMLDPNLSVHTLTTGLSQPTGIALFGNAFFVLEKDTGRVQFVSNGAVQLTALDLAVNSASERGLLGIALHPDFAFNHLVYLYWTESSTGADSTNLADVALMGNRVDRYLWNGATLTFDRNVIRLRAYQADANQPLRGNHNGGVPRFGPDGKLYILMGDNGRRGFLQNNQLGPVPDDQFGGPEPDDSHLTGFVLRLNDDGSTPTDNPFYNAATNLTGQAAANIKKLYAYGVRNGFGLAFDPLSGNLWDQENGDDAFDEMNRVTPGANNGWVETMGPVSRVAEFKSIESTYGAGNLQQLRWAPSLIADTPAAALARLYQLPGSHYNDPEFSWKYAVAPSALGFVQGRGLGAQFEGDMLVGAGRTFLSGGYLFRFKLTPDRFHFSFNDARLLDLVADNTDKFDVTESESLLIGKDFGIVTDIETGPNGNVFVVSNTNGAVYEISGIQPTLFLANLNGAQAVPPNNSAASGTAALLLSADEMSARVSLNFTGLSSQETVAHIHGPGTAGVIAPVLFPLPQGEFSDFEIPLNSSEVQELKNGQLYIDIHSGTFAGGEIRGQFQMSAATSSVQFSSANLFVSEGSGRANLSVTRIGDTSLPTTVAYATGDHAAADCNSVNTGSASARCDYETTAGSLTFAAGETAKTISILLVDDSYAEGNESFTISLSGPSSVTLGSPALVNVTITDNDASNGPNPIDDPSFFVRQHYHDFLNREPDPNGYLFWTNQISSCGADAQCLDLKRINVSAAFFLSIEFQETGYLVYRMYQAAYGNLPGAPVPLKLEEFLPDTQRIGKDVVVGQIGWEQQLENSKVAFALEFVARARFTTLYPTIMTPAQFVDALFLNEGITPTTAERTAAINEFGVSLNTTDAAARARTLRRVADNAGFKQQELNRAFVLMQYFGYLRRNPNDAPEPGLNFAGYNFWLNKLNQFNGNFVNADMVKAFLVSGEYRGRFGP